MYRNGNGDFLLRLKNNDNVSNENANEHEITGHTKY